ncbi:MAG: DUF4365 domain-containing protein [Oscillatoriales cyanobacterium C42_A2020_001]|nr:DUF4365 domain-containing protein [Leptolyngbyaceae cyanobacterium C42_A2020_001]
MTANQAWYIGQRAESLAVMYLTRRSDLTISGKNQDNLGLDFLVTINQGNDSVGRVFGVQVKAQSSAKKVQVQNGVFDINLKNLDSREVIEFPFPVCLFFFSLEDNHAYYKWLIEPVFENEKTAELVTNTKHQFYPLTTESVDEIVSIINHWYDNRKHLKVV